MFKIFLYITSIVCIVACNLDENIEAQSSKRDKSIHIQYDLNSPDQIFTLPHSLTEISGIALYKENEIACIQDEKAKIYIFNTEEDKVTSQISFGEDGDFEDIAIIGETAYVIRSDGLLTKIENLNSKNQYITLYKTPLNKSNNVEGLTNDSKTNSLLLACKEYPWIENGKSESVRSIYRFDLSNNKFIDEPQYLIDIENLNSNQIQGTIRQSFIKILKRLKIIEYPFNFSPSAIAVHPFDNDKIYVLSSNVKSLVILNRKSKELETIKLDNNLFKQPEGMCFSKNGELYISSEGKADRGKILRFNIIDN